MNEIIEVSGTSNITSTSIERGIEQRTLMIEAYHKLMLRDVDYGVIPGTQGKPTLLKPGAEKLCKLFGLRAPDPVTVDAVKDWTGKDHGGEPFFYFECRQDLLSAAGEVIAGRRACCSSWESKYRWRKADRVCPECGLPAIIKGRAEYGGGWVCFKKKGGCGYTFADNDAKITSQAVGRVPNTDIFDQVNTILQMAQKRAFVSATLIATSASEFYTQEYPESESEPAAEPAKKAETAKSAPREDRFPVAKPGEPTTKPAKKPHEISDETADRFVRLLDACTDPTDLDQIKCDIRTAPTMTPPDRERVAEAGRKAKARIDAAPSGNDEAGSHDEEPDWADARPTEAQMDAVMRPNRG